MSSTKRDFLPKRINASGVEAESESLNIWRKMPNDQYIDNIDTSGGQMEENINYNLLVSSVPSPWARVHMTSHAIRRELKEGDTRMLMKIYDFIRSEWRGLVAAFVLYPEKFELTKPVELKSDDITTREGKFDIISTFAEMLFDDADLWKYEKGGQDIPKLQLLYYINGTERKLVGSTSPFTIFFTGLDYTVTQDEERIFWVKNGKFCDPASMPIYFTKGESKYNDKHFSNLKKLYSFLGTVQKNREAYVRELRGIWDSNTQHRGDNLSATSDSRCNFVDTVLNEAIDRWMRELKDRLGEEAEKAVNLPVHLKRLEGPLGKLLTITNNYLWWNNTFYTKIDDGKGISIDVEKLFIESDSLAMWADASCIATNDHGIRQSLPEYDYRRSPVFFLEVKENGESWFVALPLSIYALDNIFQGELENIIMGKSEKVKLVAEKHGEQVDVYLKAQIDGQGDLITIRQRTFNVIVPHQSPKVFIWPNFYSSEWTRYYYYSEFPMNAPDVQMKPFFDGMEDVESSNMSNVEKDAFARLIKYPETATSSDHIYEVMRTNRPLKRIEIRKQIGSKQQCLGYLQVRTTKNQLSDGEPLAMREITFDTPKEATVGFDFGSTNSCAYYKVKDQQEINPVPFANHRLSIIGFDNKAGEVADPDELLFISNEEPVNHNGQVKSWLHEHNEKYINDNGVGKDEELVGGVPVNETNITVKSMDAYEITTNAGRLRYNMKWLVDEVGKKRKQAFVKMLWVHICADLFEKGCYPKHLNWSYPSAMGARDMTALKSIFSKSNLPKAYQSSSYQLADSKSYTEAEAVCSYFMRKGVSAEFKNLFLGIDIGGSTSDILIFGANRDSNQQSDSPQAMTSANHVEKSMKMNSASDIQTDYDKLSRKELCELVRQRGLAGKVDLDELSRTEIVEFLKNNEVSATIDYDELGRKELCELVRQRGLAGKVDLDELSRTEIVEFLKNNEVSATIDYDELGRKELCDLVRQRGLADKIDLDNSSRSNIVEFLRSHFRGVDVQTASVSVASAQNHSAIYKNDDFDPKKSYRLFTQCSVRMAAGIFFDAIINSKKFRDCIRLFHNTHQARINVVGINDIEKDPKRAPYYLNNIFDQLHGDGEFTKFYTYLQGDVPFVFALPAYITGALMAYAGMLLRNTILTRGLSEVKDIHFRYFGKGGRLFEWLFFAFDKSEIIGYLTACFRVGLKDKQISQTLGNGECRITLHFENAEAPDFGTCDNSENKSEVAYGLVAQRNDIAGIKPAVESYEEYEQSTVQEAENDARKQEVVGEVGVTLNGETVDELALVDDNFYRNPNAVVMPAAFQNFSDFMNVFAKFLSNIYPNANFLKEQVKKVEHVKSFIQNDTEYEKYIDNINKGEKDSYRMPVFVASSLYYMQEVLLKEVFKE